MNLIHFSGPQGIISLFDYRGLEDFGCCMLVVCSLQVCLPISVRKLLLLEGYQTFPCLVVHKKRKTNGTIK